MTLHHPRLWFRPKRIGFGYSPATWEGWLAVVLLVAALIAWRAWRR